MWSVLSAAWHVVARRALSDRMILLAAAVTVVLATMLVASGPIYADAVTLSAVQRTLADSDVESANVSISTRVTPDSYAATDALVSGRVAGTFDLTGFQELRRATSDSYSLPVRPGAEVTELAVFRYFEGVEAHASIVEGAWPESSSSPVSVAVPESAAGALGLAVGDELQLTNRRDGTTTVAIRVTGLFRVDRAEDPYWFADDLDLTGIVAGTSFTTYGPLVVPLPTFFRHAAPAGAKLDWRVFPAYENLAVGDLGELRNRLLGLESQLNPGREAGNQLLVETGLPDILRDTERSLLVTRSTMLIITLQFSLLAGYALLLTAGLLAESRQIEIELLRSRGAGSRQVLALALMEGTVLIIAATVAAPTLAALTLRAFNVVGPLADIDLTIAPRPTAAGYLVAAVVALGCLAALTIPSFRTARSFGTVRAARARQAGRGLAQRARIDAALLVIAGVALWQLQRYGAPITETVEGRLGIDPLLVAAPALGLVAGGVVALRTLPLLSQAAEATMTRSRRIVPVLGAWQVARRPRRYARIALFLTMAVGIGSFTVAYAGTWQQSQSDRAAYDIGAELRQDRNRRFDATFPARVWQNAYQGLPGLEAAMPVLRESGRVGRSSSTVRYVMLDAARGPGIVSFRPDLSDTPLAGLMAPLAAGRLVPAGAVLGGEPARLAVDVALVVDPLDEEPPPNVADWRLEPSLSLRAVLVDGDGHLFRVNLGALEPGGEVRRMAADLDFRLADGAVLRPPDPLALVAFEVRSAIPRFVVRSATVTIDRVSVAAGPGADWEPLEDILDPGDWFTSVIEPRVSIERPAISMDPDPADRLVVEIDTGATAAPGAIPSFFGIRRTGTPEPGPLPVIVSQDLLDELDLAVGEEIPLDLPGLDGRGLITGAVRDFPTVDPTEGEPMVLDYQTYMAARYQAGTTMPSPDEIWLSVDDDSLAAATSALSMEPFSSAASSGFEERRATLQADPVARGTIGSLFLGFVATALLTGVGFAVNAAVSARERFSEFALLRAAGLSNRQLVGWLSLENVVLVGFGLAAGTALGALLIWVVLPLTALAQDATAAVPEVQVVYPWRTILWFEGAVVTVLALAVAVLGLVLRRSGLEAILRVGGE